MSREQTTCDENCWPHCEAECVRADCMIRGCVAPACDCVRMPPVEVNE